MPLLSSQHPSCCSCDSCLCGGKCPCTETLCQCQASSVLNSLALDPTTITTTTTSTTTNTSNPNKSGGAGAVPTAGAASMINAAPGSSSSAFTDVGVDDDDDDGSSSFLVEYKVQGMKCSSCVRKIQQLVRRMGSQQSQTQSQQQQQQPTSSSVPPPQSWTDNTISMVSVDLTRGLVFVCVGHADQAEMLKQNMEQLGFEAVEILAITNKNKQQQQQQQQSSSSLMADRTTTTTATTTTSDPRNVDLAQMNARTMQQQQLQQQQQKPPSQQQRQQQQQQQHRVEIVVGGMTCTMCSKAVTSALQKVPGVEHVSVSLATNLATIDYHYSSNSSTNATTTTVSDLEEAIENVGYTVEQVMKINNDNDSNDNDHNDGDQQQGANVANGENSHHTLSSSPESRFQILQQRQEQQVRRRKYEFLWSLVATLPILCLTMILPHILPSDHPIQVWLQQGTWTLFHHVFQRESFLLWLLATPVQFVCGWTFYQRAYYNIRNNQLGMDVLVVLGTSASYGYALVATLGYGSTDEHANHHHVDHNDDGAHFFETSAVLICFVLLGKWMNALAVRRTSDALTQLMKLQAKTAIRVIPTTTNSSTNSTAGKEEKEEAASITKKSTSDASTSPQDWNPVTDAYEEQVVPIEMVHAGDIVKVIRGASIPADGIVVFGEMTVDESMITGESVPVLKTCGSTVLGGTICVETATTAPSSSSSSSSSSMGAAFCVVTGVGSSTALAQIVQLVQEAQTRQVPIQNFADTISAIFVPTVATISILTFLVWYALCNTGVVPAIWYTNLQETTATFSLMFGVACLVISCPCALGLATPTAVMVGTGVGAQHGVLLKGGEALENASKVNSVVFDKTGTLTKGKPEITDYHRLVPLRLKLSTEETLSTQESIVPSTIKQQQNYDDDDDDHLLLWLMASLERNSEHPLATAVVAYANAHISTSYLNTHPFAQPSNFRALTGRGASGTITIVPSQVVKAAAAAADSNSNAEIVAVGSDVLKVDVAVGNRAFCTLMDIAISPTAEKHMTQLEDDGKTAILATVNNQVCAVIGIADELKADAGAAIFYLRSKLGIDVWMVTGDNTRTANAIARRLNLPPDRVMSEALPVAKVQQVRRLQNSGRIVAMVGDGVNDSPALAQADVGMSLGTGAEIAAEASDMVLVRGNVQDVCTALNLSRVIFRRIQWNFVWALFYNCLGIPVAAGVFFPLIRTRLPPTVAALAMALSSLSVVSSSLALRFYKPPKIMNDPQEQQRRQSLLQFTTRWIWARSSIYFGMNQTHESVEQHQNLTLRLLDNDFVGEEHQESRPDDIQNMEEGRCVPPDSN